MTWHADEYRVCDYIKRFFQGYLQFINMLMLVENLDKKK